MNLDERIERFKSSVKDQVDQQIKDFDLNLLQKRKDAFEQAENEVFSQCYNKIQTEIAKIKSLNQRKISETAQNLKKDLLLTRNELIDQCFLTLSDKIKEFIHSDDYYKLLQQELDRCVSLVEDKNQVEIYIAEEDLLKLNSYGFIPINKKFSYGGFELKSGHKFFDCTIDNRIKKAREDFVNQFCLCV